MVSEADDAFLHVHLDHVQPKSQSEDYTINSRSAVWFLKIWTVQEPELKAKMPTKCLFQDYWLKDIAYQEWGLKDKPDKHFARCIACEIQLILCVFLTVVMVLTKSNIGPYKSLFGSSPSPREPCSCFVTHLGLCLH